MFGGQISADAQAIVAQFPSLFGNQGRRILLHPLPLYNNSIGAYDMRLMDQDILPTEVIDAAGAGIRAVYATGSFLPWQLAGREEALSKLDFLVVQELFETETTRFADVVFPAASYAEIDGTFTNNDGFVQRVRQSIEPLHQSKADWIIIAQLAKELGLDFGFEMSASAVFREIAERIPAYQGMRYPLLKDESNPVQAKHEVKQQGDISAAVGRVRDRVQAMADEGDKFHTTPEVGHELFKIGTLTDRVPQFHLLASGNPRPETTRISPLYQITVDAGVQKEVAVSGD